MRGIFLEKHSEMVEKIKLRSKVVSAMRKYLDSEGLFEVETPILCTHREGGPFSQYETVNSVTGKRYFLSFCPEDRLKRICWVFENGVYEIARCFRQESDGSSRHLSEFAMLEVKQANKSIADQIDLSFNLIKNSIFSVFGEVKVGGLDFSGYKKITCRSAILDSVGVDIIAPNCHDKLLRILDSAELRIKDRSSGWEIMDTLIKHFVEPTLTELTFLVDFPIELSTISRIEPGAKTANRFNILLGGIEIGDGGEKIIGSDGYIHLYTQNAIYRRNFLGIKENNDPCYDFFLDMEAAPPMAGFGIGIDRLISVVLGCSIEEILLFPRNWEC